MCPLTCSVIVICIQKTSQPFCYRFSTCPCPPSSVPSNKRERLCKGKSAYQSARRRTRNLQADSKKHPLKLLSPHSSNGRGWSVQASVSWNKGMEASLGRQVKRTKNTGMKNSIIQGWLRLVTWNIGTQFRHKLLSSFIQAL